MLWAHFSVRISEMVGGCGMGKNEPKEMDSQKFFEAFK
jgi:hypothetical protein